MAVDRFMTQPPFTVGRPSGQATLEPEPRAVSLTLGRCHPTYKTSFRNVGPERLRMPETVLTIIETPQSRSVNFPTL